MYVYSKLYVYNKLYLYSKLYIYTFLLLRILCYMLSRNRVNKCGIKCKVVPVRDRKALVGVEVGSNF
jgi:hypothetical protein